MTETACRFLSTIFVEFISLFYRLRTELNRFQAEDIMDLIGHTAFAYNEFGNEGEPSYGIKKDDAVDERGRIRFYSLSLVNKNLILDDRMREEAKTNPFLRDLPYVCLTHGKQEKTISTDKILYSIFIAPVVVFAELQMPYLDGARGIFTTLDTDPILSLHTQQPSFFPARYNSGFDDYSFRVRLAGAFRDNLKKSRGIVSSISFAVNASEQQVNMFILQCAKGAEVNLSLQFVSCHIAVRVMLVHSLIKG